MGFESVISGFLSIETLVFMIVIYFITATFRKVITQALAPQLAKIMPDKYEPWWILFWTKWILPGLPVLFGILFAYFIPLYPYPTVFAASLSGRICFGLVAGSISSHTYRAFKGLLIKILGTKAEEVTEKLEN